MDTTDNEIEIPSGAPLEESDMCIHSIAKTDCNKCKYNCIHGRRKRDCREWGDRLETLKNVVDRYLNIDEIDVSEPITTEHLFYDEIIYDNFTFL